MEILSKLKKYPFVVLIVPLICGILISHYVNASFFLLVNTTAFLFLLQLITIRIKQISIVVVQGMVIGLTMFLFGWLRMDIEQQKQLVNVNTDSSYVHVIEILDTPVERTSSLRTRGILLQQDSAVISCFPKPVLYLYFEPDTGTRKLKPGDIIAFTSFVQPVTNSGNPDEFDYKSYLQRRNILYQTFIKEDSWNLIGHRKISVILTAGNKTRDYAQQVFKNYIKEYPVVSAMLLGERNELDSALKDEFSKAGIMHILAISGLHVGLILLFLNTCLFFLTGTRALRTVKVLLIVLLLWIYAWLTGFSPSVVRATLMFTFFTLSQLTSKKANVYNILAFTAFVMLMLNPNNLFEVGFQLSFLAVVSILFFYPKIYRNIRFAYAIPDKIWQIMSVSLAAQVLTFPLTVFYFHQFSTWFLLANLIAIPVVFLIVLLGLVLLTISKITIVAGIIGSMSNLLIHILLSGTQFVNQLPGNLLTGLHFSKLQVVLLYLSLGLLMMVLAYPRKKYLYSIAFLIIVSFNLKTFSACRLAQQAELVVFNISGISAISIMENHNAHCMLSDTLSHKQVAYATNNYLINNDVWNNCKFESSHSFSRPHVKVLDNSQLFKFHENSIVVLRDDIRVWNIQHPLEIDYLIISEEAGFVDLQSLNKIFTVKNIVIDSSVNFYMSRQIRNSNSNGKYQIHNVNKDGAFKLTSKI